MNHTYLCALTIEEVAGLCPSAIQHYLARPATCDALAIQWRGVARDSGGVSSPTCIK